MSLERPLPEPAPRRVAVLRTDERARRATAWTGLPVVDDEADADVLVRAFPLGLALQEIGVGAPGPVVVDLVGGRVGWRKRTGATRDDVLCRALGLHRGVHRVVDATAGFGRDACALAAAGFETVAVERSPVVACLWADALARQGRPERLAFVCADARGVLQAWTGTASAPDAVYLDPMYPAGPRRALPQKEMRAVRAVVGDDDDVEQLLDAAIACAVKRVVVKRPRGAPPLRPGRAHAFEGRSTRFDLYVPERPDAAGPPG